VISKIHFHLDIFIDHLDLLTLLALGIGSKRFCSYSKRRMVWLAADKQDAKGAMFYYSFVSKLLKS
jgi:hypothetical protein